MENILFSIGNDAKSRRAKNYDMTWPEFVEEMQLYIDEPSFGIEFIGDENKTEYDRKKKKQNYIASAVDKVRSNDTVLGRSLIFIDLDGVSTREVRKVTRQLESMGLAFFAHSTSGDRHPVKGNDKLRAVRFLIPTNTPMGADEIWHVQHSFLNQFGLIDAPGVDMTANQRARIMFVPPYDAEFWEGDGKPVSVTRMMNNGYEPPSESGNTTWSDEALASASENSQAIAGWAFEMGLEMMSSGRGWAIQCPNHMAHTGNDGTDGSTAILLPDTLHPEVRFMCQHDHCRQLNSHQHLTLQMSGVPDHYLPEAHNISKKQLAEILPFADEEEIASLHIKQVDAAADGIEAHLCQDEDLLDEPCALFTKRDPIIDGLYNFKSTFELVGESNIGKSFFLLGQMACASAGIPFAGAKVIRSHSFYFDAEGGSTTLDRKQALQKTYGDNLDWLHIIDLQSEGWDLTSPTGKRAIIRHIRTVAGTDPVGLVAFDSLNQSTALSDKPFDENSSADMGAVASALKAIANDTGACAGVVHHPAKSEKGGAKRVGRGSGALHGAVDFVYVLEQPDEMQPLHLNMFSEKGRARARQLPRGFVLAKCKIDIEPGHDDAITALQSAREAPDFSQHLTGLTVKPLDLSPRDETLVLIPVALAMFESAGAAVGRQVVKEAKDKGDGPVLHGSDEQKVYHALDALQDVDDLPQGYTISQIIKESGDGGRRRPAISALIARKIICFGRDRKGRLLNGEEGRHLQLRIPKGPNDFTDVLIATDEDLENDVQPT
jgi:hypothetical protein